jgi:hypothetical protein
MTPSAHPLVFELEGIIRLPIDPRAEVAAPGASLVDDVDIATRIMRAIAAGTQSLRGIADKILRSERETSSALMALRAKGRVVLLAPGALDPSTSRWGIA